MEDKGLLISKFYDSTIDIKKEIQNIEMEYHIVLPNQYKDFLMRYNGGYTPKTNFRIKKVSSDLRGFLGVGNAKLNLRDIELTDWVKKNLFPIACDSFGNYILLGLGDDEGKVFFADHEKGYASKFLAQDVKDFIGCCKSEVIGDEFTQSIEEREAYLVAKGRGDIITDGLRKMWQCEIDKYKDIMQEEVFLD